MAARGGPIHAPSIPGRPARSPRGRRSRATPAAILALPLLIAAVTAPRPAAAEPAAGTVVVHVTGDGRPVAEAEVRSGTARVLTDASGAASLALPPGPQVLSITRLGFAPETLRVVVGSTPIERSVALREAVVEVGEVVVAATRAGKRVADEPTRVEVTGREDVEEQLAASPGNVAELLGEAGGVRVQPTSAGLGGVGVRIRGLSGRYTKFLSDGLPLAGLTAEGLGPLQVPPMDLERVEVIKGVASALYGPTALAGVVDLVSQRPGGPSRILLNQTSRGGTDAVLWASRRLNPRWGYTLLASGSRQQQRDVDGDGWTDLPGYRRVVVRPRLFRSGAGGDWGFVTAGFTAEDRVGGTAPGGRLPDGQPFRQDLDTRRADGGGVAHLVLGARTSLDLRGSATGQGRIHWFGATRERDRRITGFGEATLRATGRSQVLVAGAALERDSYHALDVAGMDYLTTTPGLFVEHLWSPKPWFSLGSSARADFHSAYGGSVNPRVSALFRPHRSWTTRLAAGSGVFAPTPFTEETEVVGLSRLRPLAGLDLERARSVSLDADGQVGPVEVDASVFRSVVERPLALRPVLLAPAELELVNAAEPTRVGGAELYLRYRREPLSVTGSYAYLDGTELDVEQGGRRPVPLNPRHAAGVTVVWEEEDDTRVGLEAYYTGRQRIADDPFRDRSRPYVFIDALLQQRLGRIVMFLHGEDLNDVRQTRFDPLVRPTPDPYGRWTTDVWAPLEGRTVNFGLELVY